MPAVDEVVDEVVDVLLVVELDVCESRSSSSCCSASATVDSASSIASCSEVGSRLAITSPAVTVSPTATATLATVPPTENAASARSAEAIVPVASIVCSTSPRLAVVVR